MAASDIVLGIDFGTSFSTAAAWIDGKMHLVVDERGEPCIPSVVRFEARTAPTIGAAAVKLRAFDPVNTISGVKRLLGRKHDSGEARIFDAHNAVPTKAGPDGTVVLITQAGDIAPGQVVTYLFKHMKALAERQFRAPIDKCVLTVPASATSKAQKVTVRAAEQAGLKVGRVLSEPAAGAVANQLEAADGRRILVYDFGGGTFDVTVLENRAGGFTARALSGDRCLGGDDLDYALANLVAGGIYKFSRIDITKDAARWDRLIRACEATKRGLSALEEAPIRLQDAYTVRGQSRDLDLVLQRSQVEPAWDELVRRSTKMTAETLVASGLRPKDIDVVLMIGGSTYVPLIRRSITRVMSRHGVHEGDPQTAVARGAALVGARALRLAA